MANFEVDDDDSKKLHLYSELSAIIDWYKYESNTKDKEEEGEQLTAQERREEVESCVVMRSNDEK